MNTHNMSIVELRCDAIRIGDRHRKDLGDLESLAASIAAEGLLQPIGITEDNVLVFGERRLRAVRDILRHPTIAALLVNVSSIVAGEYAENEVRKDFTASERVAIGKVLEAAIGNRQGRRTDVEPLQDIAQAELDLEKGDSPGIELPDNCPEVVPGAETRELASQRAGFESYKTYERAKKVVDQGVPELVEAMDSGDLSIHAASVIATQPPERQAEIVKTPREVRRQIVRGIRDAIDLPTTSEARRMARETGMLVADRTGRYRSGASAEERAATKADLDAIWDATRGVLAIADTKLDPGELAGRLEYWHCPGIREKTLVALVWLSKFQEGLKNNDQLS